MLAKMKNKIAIIATSVLLLTFSACNKKDSNSSPIDGGGTTGTTKNLFSTWTKSGAWNGMDFSLGTFNNQFTTTINHNTGNCLCSDTLISGTETSGTYRLLSCTYNGNAAHCTLYETANGVYTNSGGVLGLKLSAGSATTNTFQ